jgi:hypothetical protein
MATRPNTHQPPVVDDEEGVQTAPPDIGTIAVLNKSEIDQQVATARRYPRSIVHFRNEALELCTLDERTAAECIYALPRKQKDRDTGQWQLKTIEGPSARFAEIINYAWGNTRAGSRVISEDDSFVTTQGLFYDLEKNTAISYEVKRSIVDSQGRRYKPDMIVTTANAASSIALRNAVLKGIPKALWNPMYMASRSVVAGDIRTLANRRDEAIKAFAIFGVTPQMIYATLEVNGIQDITIDHLVVLKGILTAVQEGDTTAEQAFAPQSTQDGHLASQATSVAHGIKERYKSQQSVSEGSTVGGQPASDPPAPEEVHPGSTTLPPATDPEVQQKREKLKDQIKAIESRRPTHRRDTAPATPLASPVGIFDDDKLNRGGE